MPDPLRIINGERLISGPMNSNFLLEIRCILIPKFNPFNPGHLLIESFLCKKKISVGKRDEGSVRVCNPL